MSKVPKPLLLLPHRMGKNKELEREFEAAVAYINAYTDPFPADLLLKLYAYYKIARQNNDHPGSRTDLINAFKANALIQAQNIKPKEAMRLYIDLVENDVKKALDKSISASEMREAAEDR